MAIALHDLSRKRGGFDPESVANFSLNFWSEMCVCADCAADFADANPLAGLAEAFLGAPELVEHEREFQAKCDRLSVDAVAAADHRRHFVFAGLGGDDLAELLQIVAENAGRFV